MKKILGIIFVCLFLVGGIGIMVWNHIYGDDKEEPKGNTSVECLILQDKAYMDSLPGKVVFFESQITMPKAFNESDKFVAEEVNNVFQQELDSVVNVYEFKHLLNYSKPEITIHKNTTWMEDVVINPDSVSMTFDQAFKRAKQSDLIPSKSKYMTLRNPLGPNPCNPQYIIGNDNLGIMFVDSKTGNVTEKNPAFNK